jgi:molybdopterin converting factor small subunit
MSQVTVKIPTQLRESTGGLAEVPVDGDTVSACLDGLFAEYPALKERISDDSGIRRFVNIYVDGEDVRFLDGVDTATTGAKEITILPAVAGG